MKELYCKKCNKHIGNISTGKFRKNAVCLCEECYKTLESLANYNKNTTNTQSPDMPDFLKDLFKNKIK